jgi:hypothetical protein
MSLMDFVVSPPRCGRSVTDFWIVIYEYEVPGGALNLSSTKLPRPWSPWETSPSRKNPHGRTGNQTQDVMISMQNAIHVLVIVSQEHLEWEINSKIRY